MNDEERAALNREAEEINSRAESPTVESKAPEEVEQPNAEVATEAKGQTTETVEEEPKKGAQARIRELNQKAKLAEERAKSLEERIAELITPVGVTPNYLPQGNNQTFNPQEPIVSEGEEITAAELNRRIALQNQKLLQQIEARAELRQRQNEAITRISNETSAVMREFPQLDPENENFNKDLSDSIADATDAYVLANPYSASVKKFVSKLMKPYLGAVSTEVGKATETIAKQASQAALRPTSVRRQEKPASEKSIAELERELGIVNG